MAGGGVEGLWGPHDMSQASDGGSIDTAQPSGAGHGHGIRPSIPGASASPTPETEANGEPTRPLCPVPPSRGRAQIRIIVVPLIFPPARRGDVLSSP